MPVIPPPAYTLPATSTLNSFVAPAAPALSCSSRDPLAELVLVTATTNPSPAKLALFQVLETVIAAGPVVAVIEACGTVTEAAPLEAKLKLMLESDPVAPTVTVAGLAVAAFVIVTESTAEVVALEAMNGLPLPSLIVVTLGVVRIGEVANTKLPVPVAPVEVTPSMVWCPVNVLAASVLAIVALVVGNVIVVLSVPAKVRLLFTVNVRAFARVNVPVEEVTVIPL